MSVDLWSSWNWEKVITKPLIVLNYLNIIYFAINTKKMNGEIDIDISIENCLIVIFLIQISKQKSSTKNIKCV